MSEHEMLERVLIKAYEKIYKENAPTWAVHKRNVPTELVRPTIPFVGKQYAEQDIKILVYASAENLSDYWNGNDKHWFGDWLDDDVRATNRHRNCFDNPYLQQDRFFPHVHIEPMNNGCLATAIYYIVEKICRTTYSKPRDFYETIAFGNYSKFSIETELQRNIRSGNGSVGRKKNMDFTQISSVKEAREKLNASIAYLKADIDILEPDIIILPKTLHNINKKDFDIMKGKAVIMPIYQINAGVINRKIKPEYGGYDIKMLSDSVYAWYDQLHQGENYLSIFKYLDQVLEAER